MLKRFFISMLGTMAGLWISLFLIVFGGIMLAGISLGSAMSSETVELKKIPSFISILKEMLPTVISRCRFCSSSSRSRARLRPSMI